jgi:hypothetical protein
MRTIPTCVNDTFWNTLVIEMKDFFAEVEIFERGRATRTNPQRILIVRNRYPLLGRHGWMVVISALMRFAAHPLCNKLIIKLLPAAIFMVFGFTRLCHTQYPS